MDKDFYKTQSSLIIAVIISILALSGFLFITEIAYSPLVLMLIALFILFPFKGSSKIAGRLVLMISIIFVGWLLHDLGYALMPFVLSFLIAYLVDPFVNYLTNKKVPRWAASLAIVLIFIGIVTLIAVFVFPLIFSQLDSAIKKLSNFVVTSSQYLDSQVFYNYLADLGFPEQDVKKAIETELIPRLKDIFTVLLTALLSLLNSLSSIATQVINAILVPILAFYLLKDFPEIKELVKSILYEKNQTVLYNLRRINIILHKYIGWQVIAATIVATSCSVVFSIAGIPYPILLGLLCGVFNPIPYLGIFASMIICILTILLAFPENLLTQIIVVVATINALHFINSYFLEPNIAGRQVGLHPVLLIASLFVFGGMFGILGLIIAVPGTATLVMFFNDWRNKTSEEHLIETAEPGEPTPDPPSS
jgi:predicted PurR-regulated permease PerM